MNWKEHRWKAGSKKRRRYSAFTETHKYSLFKGKGGWIGRRYLKLKYLTHPRQFVSVKLELQVGPFGSEYEARVALETVELLT